MMCRWFFVFWSIFVAAVQYCEELQACNIGFYAILSALKDTFMTNEINFKLF